MPFSISRYSSIDLDLVVHPSLGLFGQFFHNKNQLIHIFNPKLQHFKLVMILAILKTLLVSIFELIMPMNCCVRCEILEN